MTLVRSKVMLVSMQRELNMTGEREEGESESDNNIQQQEGRLAVALAHWRRQGVLCRGGGGGGEWAGQMILV